MNKKIQKIKKPKKVKPEHALCVYCKKPIHIDDFGMINKEGVWHYECAFYKAVEEDGFILK